MVARSSSSSVRASCDRSLHPLKNKDHRLFEEEVKSLSENIGERNWVVPLPSRFWRSCKQTRVACLSITSCRRLTELVEFMSSTQVHPAGHLFGIPKTHEKVNNYNYIQPFLQLQLLVEHLKANNAQQRLFISGSAQIKKAETFCLTWSFTCIVVTKSRRRGIRHGFGHVR